MLVVGLSGGVPQASADGLRVAGSDHATVVLPAGAHVEDYENRGYKLRRDEQYAWIEVDGVPLASDFPFRMPSFDVEATDSLSLLAQRIAAGATTRFDAVSRVLAWVSANIEYRLDRTRSQEPEAVLARRSAYCTGVARLSVALLLKLGIDAREVPGFVASDAGAVGGSGYHRWIEVYYPDVGWVFSDPTRFHHYVPAHYVRLAGELLDLERMGKGGQIIRREDRIAVLDLESGVPGGVQVLPNDLSRKAAALRVETGRPGASGEVVLERSGVVYQQDLQPDGGCDFVGLSPATYTVWVRWEDGESLAREVVIDDLTRVVVNMRDSERRPPARASGKR